MKCATFTGYFPRIKNFEGVADVLQNLVPETVQPASVLAYGDSTFYPQNILFEEIFDNPRNFIIKSFMRCTYI